MSFESKPLMISDSKGLMNMIFYHDQKPYINSIFLQNTGPDKEHGSILVEELRYKYFMKTQFKKQIGKPHSTH